MELRRLLGRDDRGFSAVLGAMVLLGVGLIAFTTYQTTLAPDLEARSEAEQMATVSDELAAWVAKASLADTQGTASEASRRLPLDAGQPLFGGPPSSSTLTFKPDRGSVQLAARNLSVSHLNGTAVGGAEETWRPVDGSSLEEIAEVEALRLRIDEIDSSRTGESVTVNLSDDAGDHVGDLQVSLVDPGGGNGAGGGQGFELVVTTRNAEGTVLYDQPILISSTTHDSHSDPISPFWVNLLNEDYRFDRVLASAQAPYEITLDRDGLDADYTIEYRRSGSAERDSSGALLLQDYRRSFSQGHLAFEARADQATDQELVIEHGALVRSQADGAVFAKSPVFTATTVAHTVHVSFTWPSLTGSPDARSTDASLGIHATPADGYAVQGEATNLTVNVSTASPEIWRNLFDERLEDAGVTPDRGFTTASGSDWARVDVWGRLDPEPSSDRYDVSVDLRSPTMDVRLGN